MHKIKVNDLIGKSNSINKNDQLNIKSLLFKFKLC